MADWDAALYTRFEAERTRPAAELLARVPLDTCRHAVDLGCGPGNSTALVAARFPAADILGLDTSPDMLAAAARRLPALRFEEGDVSTFDPRPAPDLLFANAVLQWVPDHARLFPALMGRLAPGGVLAVQMPDNLGEASHRAMRETAAEAPFAAHLGDAEAVRMPILSAEAYYDLLAPLCDHVDLWRTTYHHVLDGAPAIVDWLRATGLRAFLGPLPPALHAPFLAAYEARVAKAYRQRHGGKVLLAFPRLFLVARRSRA
ncbi:trans-aconitate 2-methyltransferase [Aurantimonas sp. Leaf443]|uniref:trans-aconitate 2-methyltransferase n=1 Tax=Aurantimonas sp. Leaf443 TaxID=1736378 RepID=UPI000701D0CC|nr:trans-aconitate 2-methyltransferase [Aurantimonas sp. Leaf443]KQT82236.1 trans-aconitate methyltransferase [Aurantimonas sp. Leaf443]